MLQLVPVFLDICCWSLVHCGAEKREIVLWNLVFEDTTKCSQDSRFLRDEGGREARRRRKLSVGLILSLLSVFILRKRES